MPAKVDFADNEGNLLISFLRLPRSFDQKIPRLSPQLAPYQRYTDKWADRFNLKVDDELSCADEYGNWYRSTVMKREDSQNVLDIDGQPVTRITVGFRYLDPHGAKEDDFNRKWTGWLSQKFDADVYMALPNVQPLHSMTYQYFNVNPNMLVYDILANDLEDIIYPSSDVHEWARTRSDHFAGIQAYAEMFNEFGQQGGFEIIEQVLAQVSCGQFKVDAKYLLSLQKFLYRSLPLWTRQFTCRYADHIATCYMTAITSDKSSVIKNLDKEEIIQLASSYE